MACWPTCASVPRGTNGENNSGSCFLQDFSEDDEPAAEGFDEGNGSFVGKRRRDKRRRLGCDVAPKQHDSAARPEERLEFGEKLLFDAHCANRDGVHRFVQFGPGEQVLGPRGLDGRVAQIEVADRFAEKGRFPRLRFNHQQLNSWGRELEGNGGRPPARSDVEHVGVRTDLRVTDAVAMRTVEQPRGDERLNQEAVDRLVWRVDQRKGCQIDLLIPELEQAVVGTKGLGK